MPIKEYILKNDPFILGSVKNISIVDISNRCVVVEYTSIQNFTPDTRPECKMQMCIDMKDLLWFA